MGCGTKHQECGWKLINIKYYKIKINSGGLQVWLIICPEAGIIPPMSSAAESGLNFNHTTSAADYMP